MVIWHQSWLKTILIVRKETCCRHIGYSFQVTARVLLYAPSHRKDSTYHGLCYTSCGAMAGMRNSSMGPPHEGLIRRPIAPWANALPLSYVPLYMVKDHGDSERGNLLLPLHGLFFLISSKGSFFIYATSHRWGSIHLTLVVEHWLEWA